MKGYIYQIINKVDGRRYVGQTINLQKRKSTHYSELRSNKHPNDLLQEAWNKWGEENFQFVYEEFEIEDKNTLNQKEIETIKKFNSYEDGYNRTPGGQGGPIKRKLSYEDFCFIYYGCQWKSMTEKIGKYLQIDSSTVSSILREKAHADYLLKSKELTQEEINAIRKNFREVFNIPSSKQPDEQRVPSHLSEEEYFYCFCIAASHGRGIEQALAKYFEKHKSFLSNGLKNKTKGKVFNAYQRFLDLSVDEILKIGDDKFKEWEINKYTKFNLPLEYNNKWRN